MHLLFDITLSQGWKLVGHAYTMLERFSAAVQKDTTVGPFLLAEYKFVFLTRLIAHDHFF